MKPAFELGLLLHTRHLIRAGEKTSHVGELWETASLAEQVGFDHLWVGDSPRLSMQDRAHADCLTIMAALAARTSRIKIGVVPLILAMRNPVLTAHTLATLDVISGGRIIVGVSVGHNYPYAEREFAACGVPYGERSGRLSESIQLLRRLWSESSFAFDGRYYRFDELGIEPKPVQQPIPIWIAAHDNDKALKRTAHLGDGWFTVAPTAEEFIRRRQAMAQHAKLADRDINAMPSTLFATFYLSGGPTAEEDGWRLAENYFRQPRAKLAHLSPFFGTPAAVAQRLARYVEAGLTGIVARLIGPNTRAQMELLINELRPRLHAA